MLQAWPLIRPLWGYPGESRYLRFRRVSFTALHAERLTQGGTRWSISPLPVMRNLSLLRVLARSFLGGEATAEQITARASRTLGRQWRWLGPLVRRYLRAVAGRTRPRHRDVIRFFLDDHGFRRAWSKHFHELSVDQWLTEPQRMQPVPAAGTWNVPRIESVAALCDWLWLEPGQLEWFADLKGLCYKKNRPLLRHYHYRVLSKRDGNIRLIEAPKSRLKKLQRQILTEILERIPPHPCVHGFLKGRSIRTFAAPHVGQRVVLRMALSDFFPTFAAARIQTLFRTMGYPEPVADLLGGICTNRAPRDLWSGFPTEARGLYSRPHLPQGAPASPALANLCSYRIDCRLAGSRNRRGRGTRVTPTILLFPVVRTLREESRGSQRMSPPSCLRKGSP